MVEMLPRAPIRDMATEAREFFRIAKDPRIVLFFLLGTLGLVASSRNYRQGRGTAYIAALLATTVILPLYFRMFPMDWLRYSYNYLTLVLLASFALLLGEAEGRTWLKARIPGGPRWIGGLLILLTIAGTIYHSTSVTTTIKMISAEVFGRGWDPNAEESNYRRLQESIPAGQRLLVFLPMAHLLDFSRNPINVVDAVCGISPPPGMPLRRGPEDVAQYLRSLGITWVASRDKIWYPGGETRDPEDLRQSSETNTYSPWKSQLYSHYLMAKCVKSLEASYETTRIENDLALGEPVKAKPS